MTTKKFSLENNQQFCFTNTSCINQLITEGDAETDNPSNDKPVVVPPPKD